MEQLIFEKDKRPIVGLGLLVVRGDQILLGKRKGSHGAGEFGGPGGHLEYMEEFEDSLLREVVEEAGRELSVTNPEFLCVTNMTQYAEEKDHYVDMGFVAEWVSGDPKVMEPHKLEYWGWYDLDDLPSPLFGAVANYIMAYKTGRTFFGKKS